MRLCIVYVVKEGASFRGLSKIMGMARHRMHAQDLQTSMKLM